MQAWHGSSWREALPCAALRCSARCPLLQLHYTAGLFLCQYTRHQGFLSINQRKNGLKPWCLRCPLTLHPDPLPTLRAPLAALPPPL